jgi:hypothetical protein
MKMKDDNRLEKHRSRQERKKQITQLRQTEKKSGIIALPKIRTRNLMAIGRPRSRTAVSTYAKVTDTDTIRFNEVSEGRRADRPIT